MNNLFTAHHLELLPWLHQPVIKTRLAAATKSLAALEERSIKIQSEIDDLDAEPPRLSTQILKRRAALVKALNLTDAAVINEQQLTLIRLEKAALVTQKSAITDKRIVVQDKLNTDLAALLTVIDAPQIPGRPEWIQMIPNQPIGAGAPVLTPKNIIDAGIIAGIHRHRLAFTANQIRHRDAAAAKEAKRAAQKAKDDAVLTFTAASFNTAVQAAVRTGNRRGQRPPKQRAARQRTAPAVNSTAQRRGPPASPRPPTTQPRQVRPAHSRQPSNSRPRTATGNANGRRRSALDAGRSRQSRYHLRPTVARAARAARNGAPRI